jgi:hypothetical protein
MEEEGRRLAIQLGRQEGRQEAEKEYREALGDAIEALLKLKFGSVDLPLMEAIRHQLSLEVLRQVQRAIPTAGSVEEVQRLLP